MALGELKNGIGPDAYAIYQQVLAAVVERDHPVSSLYISDNATSPAELYGGTWERIEGRFIMGASDTYPAGSTGGSATKTIAKTNLPNEKICVYSLYTKGSEGREFDAVSLSYTHSDGSGNFSRTGRTDLLGDSTPLDILPPYYSVYIWRRVA